MDASDLWLIPPWDVVLLLLTSYHVGPRDESWPYLLMWAGGGGDGARLSQMETVTAPSEAKFGPELFVSLVIVQYGLSHIPLSQLTDLDSICQVVKHDLL